jgi:predicted DCC family thiol-disulfide oxidoreductase YuxK
MNEPVEIVLYDCDCGLCQAAIRFVLQHDDERRFRFASQFSEIGRRLLAAHGLARVQDRTVVLLSDGHAYLRSDAAVRILGHLRGLVGWAEILRAVPRPLRDAAYDVVAASRRLLGGTARSCAAAFSPELRARFLDGDGAWRPGPSRALPPERAAR